MEDEARFGYVQIGARRVYVECMTVALREGLQDSDQEHMRNLTRGGNSVGVMYEEGSQPSLGTYRPQALVYLTEGEFRTARDLGWPARLPGEAEPGAPGSHGGAVAASGELSLEVKRADGSG